MGLHSDYVLFDKFHTTLQLSYREQHIISPLTLPVANSAFCCFIDFPVSPSRIIFLVMTNTIQV